MYLGLLLHLFIAVIILEGDSVTSQPCFVEGSRCQDGGDLFQYPFWMKDDPSQLGYYCGYPGMSISCIGGKSAMTLSDHLYYVWDVDYLDSSRVRIGEVRTRGSLRLVDVDVEESDCPQQRHNISLQSTVFEEPSDWRKMMIYYNCTKSPLDLYLYHLECLDHYVDRNVTLRSFLSLYEEHVMAYSDLSQNCEETVELPNYNPYPGDSNYTQLLKYGFSLSWETPTDSLSCESSGGKRFFNETTRANDCYCDNPNKLLQSVCLDRGKAPAPSTTARSLNHQASTTEGLPIKVKVVIGVCAGLGASLVIIVVSYRRFLFSTGCLERNQSNVEVFLENCGSLATQRYKYSDIKKMTDSFKEKLGQGGFGTVFKGKIKDGRLVAVKVLNDSKSNGEDFINEVATISRTNHVNVVDLLGFCNEGTKRALVYEFMPNGSLEKFIYNAKTSSNPSLLLGWEKLYQIALGIAKGLEYLHRGCNTRILHFDIKPHNILLDEDFCPKIADFGLAKLCPTKESVVSMLVARGTIGYIAPEVYCRNFGGVSHKSDVYSYGMMVLEMIGGRKNIDVSVENMSEIYFPQWIYNHFKLDVSVDGNGEIFEDLNARKMITVALWCIQTQPSSRPSITRVVEMLEANSEDLEIPPNPFQDPLSSSPP